jgi:hypothetical protein
MRPSTAPAVCGHRIETRSGTVPIQNGLDCALDEQLPVTTLITPAPDVPSISDVERVGYRTCYPAYQIAGSSPYLRRLGCDG